MMQIEGKLLGFCQAKICLVGRPAKIVGWLFSLHAGNIWGKIFSGQK
jgi:hypothetical protein